MHAPLCPVALRFCPIAVLLLLGTIAAPASTITVGQDGASDYNVIQDAIDAATDGDEIIVNIGTYVENLHFNGKNIILRSTAPENDDIVSSTIIDGNQTGPVVTFAGTEGTTCVLSGFTITNGNGVFEHNSWSGDTIRSAAIRKGGGIFGNGAQACVERNIIWNNTAYCPGNRTSEAIYYYVPRGGAPVFVGDEVHEYFGTGG